MSGNRSVTPVQPVNSIAKLFAPAVCPEVIKDDAGTLPRLTNCGAATPPLIEQVLAVILPVKLTWPSAALTKWEAPAKMNDNANAIFFHLKYHLRNKFPYNLLTRSYHLSHSLANYGILITQHPDKAEHT